MRLLLAPLDVELVDATSFLADYPADIRNGWQLKPYAILHSRFEEVLYLDADQVPVRNPAFLFDLPEYRAAGAIFWSDINDLSEENPIWALVGLPARSCPSWESGQILVDKRRHLGTLRIALYLNEQAHFIYPLIYGDKDTFLIAWRFAGAAVAVVPHRPFVDDRVLIQRDFDGAPLFQHCTNAKWNYHVRQYQLDGFAHMEDCLAFLAELRRSWNGRQFFPPDRSTAARAEEVRLEQVRQTRLIVLGEGELILELLGGHQIGGGRRVDRQNWFVAETEAGIELIIYDGDQATYRLRRIQGGAWQGDRSSLPACEVRLDELPLAALAPRVSTCNGLVDAIVSASGVASGAGDLARVRLIDTLRLVLRAQPGLRPAMESAAKGSAVLSRVIDEVLATSARDAVKPVAKNIAVIGAGYKPPDGPSL